MLIDRLSFGVTNEAREMYFENSIQHIKRTTYILIQYTNVIKISFILNQAKPVYVLLFWISIINIKEFAEGKYIPHIDNGNQSNSNNKNTQNNLFH